MFRFKRVIDQSSSPSSTARSILSSLKVLGNEGSKFNPSFLPSHTTTSVRFLDIHQIGNKDAIAKERARLKDEMSRGYFADMADLKEHGGKIATANKTIVPAAVAVKFPTLQVSYSDGKIVRLPFRWNGEDGKAQNSDLPKAALLCLSFRASSQPMVDSWSMPFLDRFRDSKNIHLYEVSFIDSWFLSLNPIKHILLRVMKKSSLSNKEDALRRQVVYSFGDHYDFRKELKILNLLTGYMFLLDKFGRIRWQGFGMATEEEVSSLLSCASLLLEEK